jgi:MFS family permease
MNTRGSYKWAVVGMLWFICLFNYADRQAISAVFPKLKEEFGFTKAQLGYIGSAFMWVYAAGAPLAGYVGDRLRRKDLILGGCVFWSLVTMGTGWCHRFWHFVTVRALEGFGETFYFPASMSLISDYHPAQTRSRAMSLHQSSVYAGTILGSWLGAWFAEYHGWRVGFYFFGGAGLLLAALLYRSLREPRRGQSEEAQVAQAAPPQPTVGQALAPIFTSPAALLIAGAFVCANFVAAIFLTWTPTFLVEKFHFRLTTAGLSGAVFIHTASFCSVPLGGLLADKFALRLRGGRLLVQILGLLVGAVFLVWVGMAAEVTGLLIAMTGFGFCKGLYDSNIFAAIYDVVPIQARGTAAGIMNALGWIGGALGPVYVGLFSQYGTVGSEMDNMSRAISLTAFVYLGAVLLLALAFRRLSPAAGDAKSFSPRN